MPATISEIEVRRPLVRAYSRCFHTCDALAREQVLAHGRAGGA